MTRGFINVAMHFRLLEEHELPVTAHELPITNRQLLVYTE
jgi:hypothetical protein